MYCFGGRPDIPGQENENAVNDQRLLKEYAEQGSQQAFAELTQRYLRLVYATCRRETGSAELAEDATQAVFILMARKARELAGRDNLSGWLFQTSVLTARNARRSEARAREASIAREVETMSRQNSVDDSVADRHLNDALASLQAPDRDAILMRYMTGYTLAEAGAAMGITEDGARKRIERALSKLQRFLTTRGVVLGAGGVVLLLEKHSEAAANSVRDAVLHIGIAGGVAGKLAVSASTIAVAQGALRTMLMTKAATVIGLGLLVTAGVVTGSRVIAAMQPFADWPAPLDARSVTPPANGVVAPPQVRSIVEAATAGDAAAILPKVTPKLAALLTPEATQSVHVQSSALGGLNQVYITSQRADAGAVDYKFKSYYTQGTVDGEMEVDAQGKIDLLSFTPDVILAPTKPFAPLVKQTVDATIAGDASTLASISEPSISSVLSGDSLTSIQTQMQALGTV